jgi:HD-like signal output (HDOD) protein
MRMDPGRVALSKHPLHYTQMKVKGLDLPAQPEIVGEVLRLAENPNSSMSDIARVLSRDAALTTRVLKIANSPYYGMRQYVGTLQMALVILGIHEVRNVVLAVSLYESCKNKTVDPNLVAEIWDHAVRTAGVARGFAAELRIRREGQEFTAPLLADVGKILFFRYDKNRYAPIYDQNKHHPHLLSAEEQKAFGFAHADLAALMSYRWNLPIAITDSLWFQYPNPERPLSYAADPELAAVVRLAKYAQTVAGTAQDAPKLEADDEAWDILAPRYQDIAKDEMHAKLLSLAQLNKSYSMVGL